MMLLMRKIALIMLSVSLFSGEVLAQTDTVYVHKHVTDTVFVKSPPDTVYIKKSTAKFVDTIPEKNEFVTYYDTDTIPPATNFYIGGLVAGNLLTLPLGLVILDFDIEKENEYRGSVVYNVSSLIQYYDIWKEWKGLRWLFGPGVGYRQYLGSIVMTHANPKKKAVKHRNVPLNSLSFYVQAMTGPTIKFINEKNYESDRQKIKFWDFGGFVKGTFGYVWNDGNFLWGMNISGGYQYWDNQASKSLSAECFQYVHGSSLKGFFIGTEIKLGF